MDAAESNETKHDGLSININAPCTNRIASGDYIEVNVYLPSDTPETAVDAVETALRIARQVRVVESPA